MKTSHLFALMLVSFAVGVRGQTAGNSTANSTVPAPTPWAVISRHANSSVWERTSYEPAPGGKYRSHIHRYVQLATGLNHLVNGKYVPSSDNITISADGTSAMATNGQHQAYFPIDIATGVIKLVTPGGSQLTSRPIALAYDDGSNAVLIALVTNSVGAVMGANHVVYSNAFEGVSANIMYTYTKAGFEQDIVLVGSRPPSPKKFGLNPATTKLQVITEFFKAPAPVQTPGPMNQRAGLRDTTLSFGKMKMMRGRAFTIPKASGDNRETPTYKRWVHIQGRTFLIEEVPYERISSQLQTLPMSASIFRPHSGSILYKASTGYLLPPASPPKTALRQSKMMRLASADFNQSPAVVLDYVTLNSSLTNYIFKGNNTYLISGGVDIYDNVTFEGGAVIKYASSAVIQVWGNVVCNTSPYHPAVFTSREDSTVGENVSDGGSTNYSEALYIDDNTTPLHDLRISYANYGIHDHSLSLSDSQFVHCGTAIQDEWWGGGGYPCYLTNVLMVDVSNAVSGTAYTVTAYQTTIDGCAELTSDTYGPGYSSVIFTNSLLVDVQTGGDANISTNYTVWTTDAAQVFQTVGAGSCYLADHSVYRNAGTTNIASAVLADIAARTTYPPIVCSNVTFETAETFSPQAQRDTDIPDLGYHYDPLDYAFGGCTADSNLTFTAGTAATWFDLPGSGGPGYGIALTDHMVVDFEGIVTSPCVWTFHDTVQEGGNGLWTDRGWLAGLTCRYPGNSWNVSDAPQINAAFTHFSILQSDPNPFRDYWTPLVAHVTDCEFRSGGAGTYNNSYYFTNCLFYRAGAGQSQGYNSQDEFVMRNCTFYGASVNLTPNDNTIYISVRDCAFDGTTINVSNDGLNPSYVDYDYNAFTNGAPCFPIESSHSISNIVSFNWQSSWFGNYYLPPGSPLIDAGDVTADQVGLYHFTTQTNQVPETNSVVDIGYHYVATDTYGNPLDTNSDGEPDYLEDINGNGIDDSGEPPWDVGIASQPKSTNVVQGLNATFSVTPSGIGPFHYQWLLNGANIAGANSTNYTELVALPSEDGNAYSVQVSNADGSVLSSYAILSVTTPVVITNQPVDQKVIQGTNVGFEIGASGNYLDYQWYDNGVLVTNNSRISGATGPNVVISNVMALDGGYYVVEVTNLFNSVTSRTAKLTVITPPDVSSPPTGLVATQADDVTFSVTATGHDLGYQWWLTNNLETNNVSWATNRTYTKLVVQTNDSGYYAVDITNVAGSTNVSAHLTVLVPPWILQQPTSVVTNQGSNATFSISAIGTTNLTYQWLKNGTNAIAGATNSSLTLFNLQSSDAAGYSVLVSNVAGANVSAWAWLSVKLTGVGTTNGWGNGSNAPSRLPQVSMFSPTNASNTNPAVFLYGPAISIRATASSLYSYITNVAFYFTGTNYGTNFALAGTAVPGANMKFALAWTNALPGTNILKACAWDYNGKTNDSSLVYVIMDRPPTVSAGSGADLIWLEGANSTNVTLSGSVSDDGLPYGITNIHWSVESSDASHVHFGDVSSTNTTATFTSSGRYVLRLEADDGFATNSKTCTINVRRQPVAYFNTPTNNAIVLTGTPIVINATAYPYALDTQIANIQFYDNGTSLGSPLQSISNNYTMLWTNAPLWTNVLTAVATDDYGLTSTATVSIVVVPPLAVQFITPTNHQRFVTSPDYILLTAEAAGYVGSTNISVVFSNLTQSVELGPGTQSTNSTYQLLWQDVTNGTYTLSVTATDDMGHTATDTVPIIVNAMPVVYITSPTNLEPYIEITNVTLHAVAYDPNSGGSISGVGFYAFQTNLPFAVAISNATNFTLVWSNLSEKPYYYPVAAVATNNYGAVSWTGPVAFKIVSTNLSPTVAITSPTNGQVFQDGSDITITANAAGTNSTYITNVQFYVDGGSVGNATNTPYSVSKCCWKPGTYNLMALATDNVGVKSISTNVEITVSKELSTGYWDPSFSLQARGVPNNIVVGTNNTVYALLTDIDPGVNEDAGIFATTNGITWRLISSNIVDSYAIYCDGNTLYTSPKTSEDGIGR